MITEDQIFNIEKQEVFGEFTVRRINISDLEVFHNGVVVFTGEDHAVADYINSFR